VFGDALAEYRLLHRNHLPASGDFRWVRVQWVSSDRNMKHGLGRSGNSTTLSRALKSGGDFRVRPAHQTTLRGRTGPIRAGKRGRHSMMRPFSKHTFLLPQRLSPSNGAGSLIRAQNSERIASGDSHIAGVPCQQRLLVGLQRALEFKFRVFGIEIPARKFLVRSGIFPPTPSHDCVPSGWLRVIFRRTIAKARHTAAPLAARGPLVELLRVPLRDHAARVVCSQSSARQVSYGQGATSTTARPNAFARGHPPGCGSAPISSDRTWRQDRVRCHTCRTKCRADLGTSRITAEVTWPPTVLTTRAGIA